MLYHDLQGKFLIGEQFKSGKLAAYARPAKAVKKKYQGNEVKLEQTYNCEFTVIEYWYQDCYYSSIDGALLGCDAPVVYNVEVITICIPTGGDGGGTPPPNDPCVSGTTGPITISGVPPGGGEPTEPTPGDPGVGCVGDGDGSQDPPVQSTTAISKLITEFCSNMTNALKSKVEVALNEYIFDIAIQNRGCMQKFIYNQLINLPLQSKFSICMDPNKAGGTFDAAHSQ